MPECPRCSSADVHRSHARTLFERIRRDLTQKRLFRCRHCDWRGWAIPVDSPRTAVRSKATVDLEKLDAGLRDGIEKLDASLDPR